MQLGMPLESALEIFKAAKYGGTDQWIIRELPGEGKLRVLSTTIGTAAYDSNGKLQLGQILSKQYTEFEASWIASAIFAGAYNNVAKLPLLSDDLTEVVEEPYEKEGERAVVIDSIVIQRNDSDKPLATIMGDGKDGPFGKLKYTECDGFTVTQLVITPEEAVTLKRRLRAAKDVLQRYEKVGFRKVPAKQAASVVQTPSFTVPSTQEKPKLGPAYAKLTPAQLEITLAMEESFKGVPGFETYQEFHDRVSAEGVDKELSRLGMLLAALAGRF